MADTIQYNFGDSATPIQNSGNAGQPDNTLEFNFDNDTELQNHTDDEALATDSANSKLGFKQDASYRWDLHKYQSLREEMSWDLIMGRKKRDEIQAIVGSRQQEIQEKYGLSSFNTEETSPYAFKLGKYKFDIGGTIDQVFQQMDIGQEMLNPRSIPAALLSFGVRWTQNQKITAAGAALGGAITAPVGGEGAAPGAAVGETIATVKTAAETFNDVRNTAVFFDTASKEGTDFFYQAHVEGGVPLEDAKNAAVVVGIVNGGMEVWAQDILAAPFKKAGTLIGKGVQKKAAQNASKLIADGVKTKAFKEGMKAFTKQFGASMGSETLTEVLQEATKMAAEKETGQLDLSTPEKRQQAVDRLVQTGVSAAAATMILGGISGGMEVQNKRVEVASQNVDGPQVETSVSGRVLTGEEATTANAEAGANMIGNNSNGLGENGVEGQGNGTSEQQGLTGKNAGDGIIDLPSLKPEERVVVNKHVKELSNKVKSIDKEVAKAEKEFNQLEAEGKSTASVENKIGKLLDEKDATQAEMNDVKSGKKSVADITSEQVKVTPDKTLQMRKEQINSDIATTKQDIKDAETSLKFAKQGNKNTTKILERITTLNDKLDGLTNEKAMIESGGLENNDYRLPEAPDKGQVSLQRYRKQKVQELQNGITNYIRGAKEGSRQQKIETKQIHSEIEGMLKEAGVRINERGPFVNVLKNIQTVEDLAKNQSKIIEKVKEVIENRNKKAAIDKLGKLKKTIKKANVTADMRNRINYLLGLTKMNDFDSGLRQKEIEDTAKNENRPLTDAELQMLSDLQIASGFKDINGKFVRSSAELHQLNAEIAHLMATGRTLRQEHLEKIKQEKIDNINGAIEVISASKFADNKLMEMYNRSIANIGSLLNSLGGKEFMSKYDPEYQQGKMHEAVYAQNKDIRATGEKIFNVDKYKLKDKFKDMSENKFFITLENSSGGADKAGALNTDKTARAGVNEVMYTPQGVEIIKNPTPTQFRELTDRFDRENPSNPYNDPKTRRTYDEQGNEYVWLSSDSVHGFIEPYIEQVTGSKVNQDLTMLHHDFARSINKLSSLYDYRNAVENGYRGSFTEYVEPVATKSTITNVPRQISTWHLIDIYNSIKNENTAEDYFKAYGEDQIFSLLGNLTNEEIQYADYMQKIVQDYFPVANEYSKAKTGRELTKRDNYWMATSDYMNDEYNALDTYRPIASIPSFLKKKSRGVVPIPQNSMQKMFKHITQSEYIAHFEKTYTNLHDIFAEKNVRNLVEQKFGKNILQLVDREVEELSLNSRKQVISDFEKVMNGFVGKWAVAKVANPGVGIKQLAANFNYITGTNDVEGMPVADFGKHLAAGLAHPKKTFDFMFKNSPLLETRYGSGYDDAVGLAISGAEGATKGEQILTEALLSFTKMGDIGAIIYGGNSYVQYRRSKGDSKELAFEKFEKITNKTQQSNNPSSLSQLQKGRGVNFFMKFRNTSNQYARLIVEAQLGYMRGEITQLQHAKIIGMYAVVQPLLYTYLGAAIKDAGVQLAALFGGPDDDKKEATKLETFLDAMNMMLTTLVDPLPIVDEMVDNTIRNSEVYIAKQLGHPIDMPMYDMFKAQMLSDVAKGFKTLGTQLPRLGNEEAKSPFNLAKTIYAFGLIQEPLTRVPVKLLFDTADIFSGGAVNKAMDKKKEKEYSNKSKKDSMFADGASESMFAKPEEQNMFADDKEGSMFADGK